MRTLRALSHWISRNFNCLTHPFCSSQVCITPRLTRQYRYKCSTSLLKSSLFFPYQQDQRIPVRIRTQRIW